MVLKVRKIQNQGIDRGKLSLRLADWTTSYRQHD